MKQREKDVKKGKKLKRAQHGERSCRRRVRYLNDFASLPRCGCLNLNVFYSLHSATAAPNIFKGDRRGTRGLGSPKRQTETHTHTSETSLQK